MGVALAFNHSLKGGCELVPSVLCLFKDLSWTRLCFRLQPWNFTRHKGSYLRTSTGDKHMLTYLAPISYWGIMGSGLVQVQLWVIIGNCFSLSSRWLYGWPVTHWSLCVGVCACACGVCVRVSARALLFAYPKPLLNRLNRIIVWIIHTDVRVCVQFAEKFAEYKEAARLAKEKSQEKTEMAKSPSQVGSGWGVFFFFFWYRIFTTVRRT